MIPEFGLFSLIIALCFSGILIAGGLYRPLAILQRPAILGLSAFVTFGFLTLVYCFVQDDFSVSYVAHNSNTALPLVYKLCATWGGHEGSLLLWVFILSSWSLGVMLLSRALPFPIARSLYAVLGAIHAGFLLLLLHTSNPFVRLLPVMPSEGADLNPLLQDPGFVIHPPFLYLGYVGFAIPFAFACAAMLNPSEPFAWAKWARPYALMAFAFLTIGISLGSWWAYYELGWGGWWFWDPVENASFMPWLVGAALVHALRISSLKPLFNSWSLLLAICAFMLSLVGTFLVRSGVLSSVHAFASDPLRGVFILYFLSAIMIGSFALYIFHLQQSQPQMKLRFISKESFILLGNIIFVTATATVLLGTLYPLIMEVMSHEKISVGSPYYAAVFVPIMMPLLLLMSLAPYTFWEQDSIKAVMQRILKPLLLGIALLVAAYEFWPLPIVSLVGVGLGALVVVSALFQLRSRWSFIKIGMVLAHVGLGLAVLGISLTTALETETEVQLAIGKSTQVADYNVKFAALSDQEGPNYVGKQGHFVISQNDKILANLYPEKRFFTARETMMTETAIDPGLFRDFYIALGERFNDGSWSVRIYVKPFVRWLWLGGIMVALGAFIAALSALQSKNERRRVA
ncbi:MAG: heme lyase CcmF/NrfE family subunit [Candidatus Berkiella sp.]